MQSGRTGNTAVGGHTQSADTPTRDRAGSWSRFWASGALHSCAGSFEGNYGGQVREFWTRAVRGFPPGGQVLDLCTGNGALPKLFLELLAGDRASRIDAVDLATIRPDWLGTLDPSARARLQFHSATPIERVPLPDASVDLAVSQFGFEYTQLQESLPELRRLLRGNGRAALIVHATDSLTARISRAEHEHLQWIQRSAVLELASAMCEPMSRLASASGRQALQADAGANALRGKFNQAMQALATRGDTAAHASMLIELLPALATVLDGCAHTGNAQAGRDEIARMRLGFEDYALRIDELLACAMSRDAATMLLDPLGPRQQTVEAVHFDNGELLGWGLMATLQEA
jgi:ubiquinone/menaquinone biosynthesis C-methylase UbiE